ncbi:hypothetical protein AVEN_88998-1 [Araneus ventricosus]|uniref:Uncharacterized protein n=1 Tax=Araneus ventricosus TaxID=182803 RepID=A0A4Y2DLE2_ARAVE|nr:hypothetical protein AVEN_88998-1 [Araneus ventricosus]
MNLSIPTVRKRKKHSFLRSEKEAPTAAFCAISPVSKFFGLGGSEQHNSWSLERDDVIEPIEEERSEGGRGGISDFFRQTMAARGDGFPLWRAVG